MSWDDRKHAPRRSTPAAWRTPAPQAVYQSYRNAPSGGLSYPLNVPDGDYTIRLHFAEHEFFYVGARVFDIRLQGVTVRSKYDIFADAGAAHRATVQTFTVTASGGTGILLELINRGTNGPPSSPGSS